MGALFAWVKDRCGPALIVAAVVLGPGSILTSSKVGCQYGYGMLSVVAMAGLLMVGATALSSRLGASLDGSLCDELAANVGRPLRSASRAAHSEQLAVGGSWVRWRKRG